MSLPFFFFFASSTLIWMQCCYTLASEHGGKKTRESFWICSLVLGWRPETRTPNGERECRNSSFSSSYLLLFSWPRPQGILLQGKKRKYRKLKKPVLQGKNTCLSFGFTYSFKRGRGEVLQLFTSLCPHSRKGRTWFPSWKCIKEHGRVVSLHQKMEPLKIKVLGRR